MLTNRRNPPSDAQSYDTKHTKKISVLTRLKTAVPKRQLHLGRIKTASESAMATHSLLWRTDLRSPTSYPLCR